MSEIKKLIERLCPDGVEFKKLGELGKITIGEFVHKNKQNPNSLYPVYNGGTSETGFYDQYNNTENKIVISARGASAGYVNRVFCKFWAGNSSYTIDIDEKNASWNYVYYCLKNDQEKLISKQQKGGVPAISKSQVENFEIPVPPLEVQSKIVEILDNFTELEAELEEKLEAELEARRKQYEYYRNQLFSFENDEGHDNVKWINLGEIGTLTRGKRFVRTDIVETGVPCIHYGDMYTYYGLKADKAKTHLTPEKAAKMRFANKNDVVIVGAGENKNDIGVGVAWLGEENVAVHDACYIFKSELYPLYVSHFLRSDVYHQQIFPLVSEGKICSISAQSIGRAKIPVPPMEEQKRIASILDRFEVLTTDLQSGLPAEIKARRKQYEHYREALLTFKRKVV